MTGVIAVNKGQEFTSFDVVAIMRGILKEKKIGHTGTLDPMATGVLPILVGRATKACDLLPDTDKTYITSFRIGSKTNTGDIWGETIKTSDAIPTKEEIEGALNDFRGKILQLPPMYSAVSVNGQRLYDLARKGIEVEREKREVYISELELVDYNQGEGELKISCSKGTYIRTLIEDISESIGALATMSGLVRTYACGFEIENSYTLEQLRHARDEGKLEEIVKPVDTLFYDFDKVEVSEAQAKRFLNGGTLDINRIKGIIDKKGKKVYRIYEKGDFLGLAKLDISVESLKFIKHFK